MMAKTLAVKNKYAAGWRAAALCVGAQLMLLFATPACAQTPDNPPYILSRTTQFTYYQAADGPLAGLVKTEVVEPNNPDLCVSTTYTYDAYGNRNGATTASCNGVSSRADFASRSSGTNYNGAGSATITTNNGPAQVAEVPGLFPATATNALSQSESSSYDPRFGVPLSLTGPNQITTNWTLDDWGRKIVETLGDGTKTYTFYCYIAGRANDISSNTPGCASPATAEIPPDAVAFVETYKHDSTTGYDCSNGQCGPFTRVYTDKLGRQIRSVTESFDGAQQPGAFSNSAVVQDDVYSVYGVKIIQTQPYFLSSGSSTLGGSNDVGATFMVYDTLGRVTDRYVADKTASGPSTSTLSATEGFLQGGSVQYGTYIVTSVATVHTQFSYEGLNTLTIHGSGSKLEEKNAAGEVIRITDELGAQIAYQRDAFGNLINTRDALQNVIALTYDIHGHKLTMQDPDAGAWTYCYDALGELVLQQNSNMSGTNTPQACPGPAFTPFKQAQLAAHWTQMSYDQLGRMIQRLEPDYGSYWSYDTYADGTPCNKGIGKLCESSTDTGPGRKITYDNYGRPVVSQLQVNNATNPDGSTATPQYFVSGVGYDPVSGRVTSQTYPTGLQVGYAYTQHGFLSQVNLLTQATVQPLSSAGSNSGVAPGAAQTLAAGSSLWTAQTIDAWGMVEQQQYGNGVVTTAVYDSLRGRVTDVSAGANGTVLSQHYVWNGLNQLMQRTDDNGDTSSGVSSGAVHETFGYDALHRLTSYEVDAPQLADMTRTTTLQYNALGMLLYKSDVGNYSYNAQGGANPHALQSVTGSSTTAYQYDLNGNLVTASAGKYSSITYTTFNLPDSQTGVQGPAGTPQYLWIYDENHQRIQELRTDSSGTRTTYYDHPDNQGGLGFESEVAPDGTVSNRHFISAAGQVIGVLVSNSAAIPSVSPVGSAEVATPTVLSSIALVKVEYWHHDHLGSLITTTDHTGAVTERYAYDPYGKRRFLNGAYDENGVVVADWSSTRDWGTSRGYTGHEQLDDVGLIHMNGRIFDPTLGVFLQADPYIQNPRNLQNFNRYAYCYNNPLTCTDPSGQQDAPAGGGDGGDGADATADSTPNVCTTGDCTTADEINVWLDADGNVVTPPTPDSSLPTVYVCSRCGAATSGYATAVYSIPDPESVFTPSATGSGPTWVSTALEAISNATRSVASFISDASNSFEFWNRAIPTAASFQQGAAQRFSSHCLDNCTNHDILVSTTADTFHGAAKAVAQTANQYPRQIVTNVALGFGGEAAEAWFAARQLSSLAVEPPGPEVQLLPDFIFSSKAPRQVTPGVRVLEGQYINDQGRVEPWTAYYDVYGRQIGRTDFNAGNLAAGIPDVHYHTYEWGPGKTPMETGSHLPGEYSPGGN